MSPGWNAIHIIEADRDARVTGIAGQPFGLTWPAGRRQAQHVPDIFCRMFDGRGAVTDCSPIAMGKADADFLHKCAVTAAACRFPMEHRAARRMGASLLLQQVRTAR